MSQDDAITLLANKLDQRFDKIDKRFDEIDERFEQVDKQFEKIDERFEQVDAKLTNHDKSFEKLLKVIEATNRNLQLHAEASAQQHKEMNSAIFELSGQIKDYHEEMILLARKVDRMERWIHEIAAKTGVSLSYD